jgi:hypothetical protein
MACLGKTLGVICVMRKHRQHMESFMAVSAHLDTLHSKHATLETKIQAELRHPIPDNIRVQRLKKQKLQIKDTIKQFSEGS